MNVKIFPLTQEYMQLGSADWEYHDIDLSRAWQDANKLKAPFKHKEDQWDEDRWDTVTRIYFPYDVGGPIGLLAEQTGVVKWIALKPLGQVTDADAESWGYKSTFENVCYTDGSPSREWQDWSPSQNMQRHWAELGSLPWVWVVGLSE